MTEKQRIYRSEAIDTPLSWAEAGSGVRISNIQQGMSKEEGTEKGRKEEERKDDIAAKLAL